MMSHYVVLHKKSSLHYPQAIGLAKSANKTFVWILAKLVNLNYTLGQKASCYFMGLAHIIQSSHWANTIQIGFWDGSNHTNRVCGA